MIKLFHLFNFRRSPSFPGTSNSLPPPTFAPTKLNSLFHQELRQDHAQDVDNIHNLSRQITITVTINKNGEIHFFSPARSLSYFLRFSSSVCYLRQFFFKNIRNEDEKYLIIFYAIDKILLDIHNTHTNSCSRAQTVGNLFVQFLS
jgi:hypothetical protein